MADESCIHCGQPAEDDDRETESGRVHVRCWDAFSEEKPVAKSSVVAGCFGLSMVAGGATVLSIGLAALAMASSLHSVDAQNPLVGIPAAIMWFMAMAVAYSAIPAGAIMLSIAFFTWVVTNNNAFKNYSALGVVAIVVGVVGYGSGFSFSKKIPPPYLRPNVAGSSYSNHDPWASICKVEYTRKGVDVFNYPNRYNNGPKGFEGHSVDGVSQGLQTGWNKKGQKNFEVYCVDGKNDGLQVLWHSNGQKTSEYNFLNGKREGLQQEWSPFSQLLRNQTKYANGEMISYTSWDDDGQKTNHRERISSKTPNVWSQQSWDKSGTLRLRSRLNINENGQDEVTEYEYWDAEGEPTLEPYKPAYR